MKTLLLVSSLYIFINFKYLTKYFAQSPVWSSAMLVFLCGTPTWWLESSVNIWNLLWLSRKLTSVLNKQAFTLKHFS